MPRLSARRTPLSPAAATSLFRNIFTTLPDGTRFPQRRKNESSAAQSFPTSSWTIPLSRRQHTVHSRRSPRTGKSSRSCATTCRSASPAMVNSAPISSATVVRPASLSRCSNTCSSAAHPAITTDCLTSAAPSPEACSSFRPRHFWSPSPKTSLGLWRPPLRRRRSNPHNPSRRCMMVHSASAPSKETSGMNNLHRELAPISDAAWAQIEEETSRTLKRYLAGRRVVDVHGPGSVGLSAVGTGHLRTIAAPADGMLARRREVKALIELRVPFELDRQAIDDVERGANDSDWQPARDAARQIAFAEDGAIFDGYAAAGIGGIRQGTSNPVMTRRRTCVTTRRPLPRP